MARKIVIIDAETDPFRRGRLNIRPFLWGMFDGQTVSYYETAEEVAKVLSQERFIVYAHNGGKFDYHFLLDFINPFEPLMVVNARIAKMQMGACEFRDSYSIIPMALSAYKKDNIDYSILEEDVRQKPENQKIIREYLRGDLIYTYDMVKSFVDEYGYNLTLASSAFREWRRITGNKNPITTKNFYDAVHPFYYGGRVQCFHLGEIHGHFSIYDVNSAYPFAMLKEHPYGSSFTISKRLPSKDVETCFIRLTCQSTGAFPFRSKQGLYFPNDGQIREFTMTGYEYLKAKELKLCQGETIKEVFVFPEKINFKQYVEHFFKKKQTAENEGNILKRNEAKLFLNGLYGKFAANPSEYREYMPVHPRYIQGSGVEGWQFNSMFGPWALLYRPLPEDRQNYYNLATGASITGAQRALMMEAIANVEYPLYCDTDSIVCKKPGRLHTGGSLGDWKKEADCDYGAIGGKKLYAFRKRDGRYKIASKGVKLTSAEVIKIAKGGVIESENEAPTFSLHKDPYFTKRRIMMKKELQTLDLC